jgi:hypothetical protein
MMVAASAVALSLSFDIEMRNDLSSTVLVELRQYCSESEDGSRPARWSEDLLFESVSGDLLPGEEDTATFDAAGDCWVVWVARDFGTGRIRCTGEIAPRIEKVRVVLEQTNCGRLQ